MGKKPLNDLMLTVGAFLFFAPSATVLADIVIDGNVAPDPQTVQTDREILDYWTPQRIASARSAIILLEGGPTPTTTNHEPTDEPGVGYSSADGSATTVLVGDDARAVLALTGAVNNYVIETTAFGDGLYSYPPPESTYAVPLSWYGSFPIRAVGKVYFEQGGGNFVCSGAVIGGTSGDVIQTAGHCVSDGAGTYSTMVLFKPAHRPSWDCPYGCWTYKTVAARSNWHNNGSFCEDIGCIVANKNANGKSITQVVGNFGFIYNAPRKQHWHIFGYPAAGSWSGEVIIASAASYNLDDTPDGCTPATMGAGWGQAGGSSGGPWVHIYKPQQSGNNNYINGVNSYFYTNPDQPLQIYSPYFGNEWKSLYDVCGNL